MNVFGDLVKQHNEVISNHFERNESLIIQMAHECARAIRTGGKILVFGNGGSASDAQHFVTELVVKYDQSRRAYPAICLNSDTTLITACSNDFGYQTVFSRQLQALLSDNDVVIAISTSGTSENISHALETINRIKSVPVFLLTSEKLNSDHINNTLSTAIKVPSQITARIQEAHITTLHVLVELIEKDVE